MEERVGRRLIVIAKSLRARFEALLAEHGVSLATFVVLNDAIEGDGLSQRELATRIGIEGPTLTRHLDRMEDFGLIARTRDTADRRILRITPTALGLELHGKLLDVAAVMEDELLDGIGDRERQTLRRLLDRLATNLESHVHAAAR